MANIFKTDRLFLNPPNSIFSLKTNIQLKPIQEIFFTFLQIHNLDLKQKIKINQKPSNPDSKDKISNNVNIKGSIFFHNISLKIILNNWIIYWRQYGFFDDNNSLVFEIKGLNQADNLTINHQALFKKLLVCALIHKFNFVRTKYKQNFVLGTICELEGLKKINDCLKLLPHFDEVMLIWFLNMFVKEFDWLQEIFSISKQSICVVEKVENIQYKINLFSERFKMFLALQNQITRDDFIKAVFALKKSCC